MSGLGIAVIDAPGDLFGADDERQRANRARAAAKGLEPCATCGRGVKPGNGWVVEVIDGGSRIAHPGLGADPNDPGYMGTWLLGPECGRHVPREFRVKWNGWNG